MDPPAASAVSTPQPAEKKPFAWQPLTPGGLVRFAKASLGRLWLVQLVVALFSAGCVVWTLNRAWVPVVSEAAAELPLESEIRHGRMTWKGTTPECLAENRFLSISIDPKHEGQSRSPAHVQAEFGETTVKFLSLLGFVELRYPADWWIKLGRADAQPWWDAWRPALLAMAGAFVVASLMICWAVLASIYFLPVRLAAFLSDRSLSLTGSWRLSGAALLPGAFFLSFIVVLYALGWLDLLLLGLAVAVHFLIGWIYAGLATFRLPREQEKGSSTTNPFAAKHH